VKYGFIREHAGRWPVVHQCRLLGVQRSAYYDWREQPCKVFPPEELVLRRRMNELFRASRDSLGSRTLAENLRKAAIADIREYVAVYYNSKRLHSTLGYKTPMNYEKDLNKEPGIC
jgi:putative transposase